MTSIRQTGLNALTGLFGNENDMDEWKSGPPPKQGWYDCRIDGDEEDRLQLWVCVMNPKKKHWKNRRGEYMDQHKIEWFGSAETNP